LSKGACGGTVQCTSAFIHNVSAGIVNKLVENS